MRRDMVLNGALGLFQIPYATLKYRVNVTATQKALWDEKEAKSVGHPSVCSVGKDNKLALRLKDLAGRFMGYSPKQICRTAFFFANLNNINHPCDKEKMCAAKDGFSSFLKRNWGISLRKPDVLWRERARGRNRITVDNILIYTEMCVRNSISVTNHTLFSIWTRQGILLIMALRKISPALKGSENWLLHAAGNLHIYFPFYYFQVGSFQVISMTMFSSNGIEVFRWHR
jgi:hypothetical protein